MARQKEKKPHTNEMCEAVSTQEKHNTPREEVQDEKIGKSREWTCLVYPESAPENWRELLQQTFLEAYISPEHNKDVNPDGNPKKTHYHIVLAWNGPTTFSNAKKICETFGGVIEPRVVGSLRGICRYLCHLDNPEKAQYDPSDVVCLNGADWTTAINLKSDKYKSIEEMQDFCVKYGITSYRVLSDYARKERKADWFRTLCDNGSLVMLQYIKSLQWEKETYGSIEPTEDIYQQIKKEESEEQ